jgi:hypothetical protein
MGPGIKSHPVFLVNMTIDPETLYQGENRETQTKGEETTIMRGMGFWASSAIRKQQIIAEF